MTKVEVTFCLKGQLTDQMMERITKAHSTYGFNRIRLTPDLDRIIVNYDATRLTLNDVAAALARAGIPAEQVEE